MSYVDLFGLDTVGTTIKVIGIVMTQADSTVPGQADVLCRRERIIRVRHHTSPEGLAWIKRCATINPSRCGGVDIEIEPFGTVALYRTDSPKRRFGTAGEGAYVEFEAYPDSES